MINKVSIKLKVKMKCMFCRRNVWSDPLLADRLANYTKSSSSSNGVRRVREWTAGAVGHYAGYHCSWCYHPEGIRTKFVALKPRIKAN